MIYNCMYMILYEKIKNSNCIMITYACIYLSVTGRSLQHPDNLTDYGGIACLPRKCWNPVFPIMDLPSQPKQALPVSSAGM